MVPRHRAGGFSRVELFALIAVLGIVGATALPVLGTMRGTTRATVSLRNLTAIGVAHRFYATDWNGRQVTIIDKTISEFGFEPTTAFTNYFNENGGAHPPIILGWGAFGGGAMLFSYAQPPTASANHSLVQPIVFSEINGLRGLGSFRLLNARPLHTYLDGRFYDPVFYAPADEVAFATATPAFGQPWEYVRDVDVNAAQVGGVPAWSSYCFSPAAFFPPEVMRRPLEGGWQDPWQLDDGFDVPAIDQVQFPALKTQLMEHHWNQSPPARCNPEFSPGTFGDSPGCEPYYFNHGLDSAPATLFYDLSARLVSNREVVGADAQLRRQVGEGLWSRDTPFGTDGYFGEFGIGDVTTSHHILTTGGVLGRDVFGSRRVAPRGANR